MKKILGMFIFTVLVCANIYAQNQVLNLYGENDFMDAGTHNLGNTDITLEMWIKTNDNTDGYVFGGWDTPPSPRVQFTVNVGSAGDDKVNMFSWSSLIRIHSTTNVTDEQWHHITYKYSDSMMSIYINGIEEVSDNAGSIDWNDWDWVVGKSGRESNESDYNGFIDEIKLWDYARTTEEIQNDMFDTLEGNETGLVGYWNFDDGTANDLTATGNDGTLYGDATIIQEEIPGFFNANFTSPETAYIGQQIQFIDTSTGNPTTWKWDFENDGIYDSFIQNPAHTYNAEGIYSVKLKISNETLVDSLIKENLISVSYCPPASPQNVNVDIIQPDAVISWTEVDTTDCGSTIIPDGYIIQYSENEEDYFFLNYTTELSYVHTFVAQFSPQMFYRVVAFKDFSREQIEYLESLNNSREKIKWSEVKQNLEIFK